ncbi:MAG: AAA family ATPase [Tissierellia bacterium]|nr:AAA family ATPase [Tissierellia bacterium]
MIKKLELWDFGTFHQKEVTFSSGLNLFYGPNEGGKSHIRDFILAMLYGFSKDSTKSRLYSKAYDHYLPNQGLAFGGAMEVQVGQDHYRIERNFLKERESCYFFNKTRKEDLSENPSLFKYSRIPQPGVYLYGMNQDHFLELYSLGSLRGKGPEALSEEIRTLMDNLQATGAYKYSIKKALALLEEKEAALGTLRAKKSPLGQLEDQIQDLKKEAQDFYSYKNRRFALMAAEEDLATRARQLEEEIGSLEEDKRRREEDWEKDQERGDFSDFLKMRDRLQDYQRQRTLLEEDLSRLEAETKGTPSLEGRRTRRKILVFTALGLALANFAFFRIRDGVTGLPILVSLALLGALGIFLGGQKKGEDLPEPRDLYARLDQVFMEEEKDLEAFFKAHKVLLKGKIGRDGLRDYLLSGAFMEVLEGPDLGELQDLDQALGDLREAYYQLDKKRVTYSHHLEEAEKNFMAAKRAKDQVEDLSRQREDLLHKKRLIEKARDLLEGLAYRESKGVFEDFLGDFQAIFKEMSNSTYRLGAFGKLEDLYFLSPEGGRLRLDQLSQGTLDQVYLALRLALVRLDKKEEAPLILDDSLVYFDQDRLAGFLKSLAQWPRQVFLFSAQAREKEILDEAGLAYRQVQIK